jgi:hypothetical protein
LSGKLRLSAAVLVLSLMALDIGCSDTQPNRTLVFSVGDSNASQLTPTLAPNVIATPTLPPTPTPFLEAPIAQFEPTFGAGAATPDSTATTTPEPTSSPTATVPTTAIPDMTPVPIPTPVRTAKVIPTASPTQTPFSTIVPTTVSTPAPTPRSASIATLAPTASPTAVVANVVVQCVFFDGAGEDY